MWKSEGGKFKVVLWKEEVILLPDFLEAGYRGGNICLGLDGGDWIPGPPQGLELYDYRHFYVPYLLGFCPPSTHPSVLLRYSWQNCRYLKCTTWFDISIQTIYIVKGFIPLGATFFWSNWGLDVFLFHAKNGGVGGGRERVSGLWGNEYVCSKTGELWNCIPHLRT